MGFSADCFRCSSIRRLISECGTDKTAFIAFLNRSNASGPSTISVWDFMTPSWHEIWLIGRIPKPVGIGDHLAAFAKSTMWLAAASRFEFSVDRTVDLYVSFTWVPLTASTDHIRIRSVPISLPHNIVTPVSHRKPWISNKQQIGPPALVLVYVYKHNLLSLRRNSKIELARLSAFPYSVLIEQLAQVLWANPYNRCRRGSAHV